MTNVRRVTQISAGVRGNGPCSNLLGADAPAYSRTDC